MIFNGIGESTLEYIGLPNVPWNELLNAREAETAAHFKATDRALVLITCSSRPDQPSVINMSSTRDFFSAGRNVVLIWLVRTAYYHLYIAAILGIDRPNKRQVLKQRTCWVLYLMRQSQEFPYNANLWRKLGLLRTAAIPMARHLVP